MIVSKAQLSTLIFLLLLGSCSPRTSSRLSLSELWEGKTRYELLQAKGLPLRESDDGKDGKILLYESNRLQPVMRTMPNGERRQANILHRVRTHFFLDSTEHIYKVLLESDPLQ